MKTIKSLLLLTLFYSCAAQPKNINLTINKDDNSLLWRVSGNGLKQPSYLFGTFHLMCKDDIHFSDQLKTAFNNADKVYMELDMDDPATMLAGLLLVNMKDGKKLQQLYSVAAYKRVSSFFSDSLQMPLSFIEHMKPFFLEALLYPKMMPCKTFSGVKN